MILDKEIQSVQLFRNVVVLGVVCLRAVLNFTWCQERQGSIRKNLVHVLCGPWVTSWELVVQMYLSLVQRDKNTFIFTFTYCIQYYHSSGCQFKY